MKVEKLIALSACSEAVEWASKQPSRQKAWDACHRGDWMLWLLGCTVVKDSPQHKAVVLAACKCTRISLEHVRKGEKRPLVAIQTAEKWCAGTATTEQVRTAAYAAYAAYDAAAYDADAAAYAAAAAAAYAAYDAAAAAYAADDAAAYAADAAAYAAAAAAYAADAADDASSQKARSQVLLQCANIVRKAFPKPPAVK